MATRTEAADALQIGRAFGEAYATADYPTLEALLHPRARLRALVRGELLEFDGLKGIVDEDLREFLAGYDGHDVLRLDVALESGRVLIHNTWRLHRSPESWLLNFHELCDLEEGRVKTIDVICSGPVPES